MQMPMQPLMQQQQQTQIQRVHRAGPRRPPLLLGRWLSLR
jgi:hypothetical protein